MDEWIISLAIPDCSVLRSDAKEPSFRSGDCVANLMKNSKCVLTLLGAFMSAIEAIRSRLCKKSFRLQLPQDVGILRIHCDDTQLAPAHLSMSDGDNPGNLCQFWKCALCCLYPGDSI